MATYLTRTQATGTSRKIFTVSIWIKKTTNSPGHEQYLFHSWNDGNNRFMVALQNDDTLQVRERASASTPLQIDTNRKFRDTNAWYHIVVRVDTTQSTASDRIRIYINGEQETSFSGASYPTQNLDLQIGTSSHTFYLAEYGGGGNNFNGLASHWNFADGQSLAPTAFGEYDANGVWKIKTAPSVTYGNNGFFILKDGNSVTDQSGNSNNFTVASGTLTKTEDSPSNVFTTMNPLDNYYQGSTFSNGNNTVATNSSGNDSNPNSAGIGITTGKFYWETKFVSLASGTAYALTGIMAKTPAGSGNYLGGYDDTYGYAGWSGTVYNNGGSTGNTSGLATYTTGDILSIALDADNNRLYFYKNGAIQNSGTGIVIPAAADTEFGAWMPAVGDWGNTSHVWSCNFGNGTFGTTAVSSAGTNASGNGIFEYDVPTGYTALSTKGLNL
jgi:hypothetical protein